MKGRFWAIAVFVAALIFSASTGYAETNDTIKIHSDLDKRTVVIEGTVDADCPDILMIVYKPGKEASDISTEPSEEIISRIETLAVEENGRFRTEFEMEDRESGLYSAYFKAGGQVWRKSFPFTSAERLKEALTVINGLDAGSGAEAASAAYAEYHEALRLPDKQFSALSDAEQAELLTEVFAVTDPYKSGTELCARFTSEVLTVYANGAAEAERLQAMLGEYESVLGFEADKNLFGVYITTQEQRADICRELIDRGGYADAEAVCNAYREFALIKAANDITGGNDMHHFLVTFQSELGNITFTVYNRLSNTAKKTVDLKMEAAEFKRLEDIKIAFDQYVDEAAEEKNTGGNHSNQGGGGSSPAVSFEVPPEQERPGAQQDVQPAELDIFMDLNSVQWAKPAITALYRLGIVNGKSEGVFDPQTMVTRAEFVKLLCAAMDLKESDGAAAEYTDVGADDWCKEYITAATQHGLVNGNPDGSFGKDQPILRQDIAVILYRALTKAGMQWDDEAAETFADADQIDEYAAESAGRLRQAGIVNGVGENRFEPKSAASRAEAAKMIYEFYHTINSL